MSTNKTTNNRKITLVLGSLFFCFVLLLLGEILCRALCGFTLLGTSRNLFMANAYGTSMGNARNIEAISFGTKVYTDIYGFRVPKDANEYKNNYKEAILILGDSVGFGSGVNENDTFSGKLRLSFPSKIIYNSSVIGYNVIDYKNVVEHFLPFHDEIDKVYLIFCLNDIDSESARDIREVLGISKVKDEFQFGFVSLFKNVSFISAINDFLRAHSKLYLLIRHNLTKHKLPYWIWQHDLAFYAEENNPKFSRIMQSIIDIDRLLKNKGKSFTVIIIPYAAQFIESDHTKEMLPQERLSRFFEKNGIDYFDAYKKFKTYSVDPKKTFLPYDSMHLSKEGHAIIHEIISSTL